MTARWIRRCLGVVSAVLILGAAACGDDSSGRDGAEDPEGTDAIDTGGEEGSGARVPGAEWETGEPGELGMDADRLDEARAYAFAEGRNTQGVVVVRDGAVVAEWYADDVGPDSWATSWSVGKSFASALVGIAIEEGLIPSVEEPMITYYPDWEGTPREDITLRDVLHMASGLDFTESYDPDDLESSDIIQMTVFQPDQLAYAAERPVLHAPGTEFNYSSGDTMLLSGVLEQATGMPASEYADEVLFGPLGIDQVEWWEDAEGQTLTYCCLDTPTLDYARFGLLYLRGGDWGGDQIVPTDWVEDSFAPSPASEGYGYQWWLTGATDDDLPDDIVAARGHDGQYIYVIPDLDLVVVRNSIYTKYDGDPVADPNLFEKLPNALVPDLGTVGADPEVGWDDAEFLTPIIDSVAGDTGSGDTEGD